MAPRHSSVFGPTAEYPRSTTDVYAFSLPITGTLELLDLRPILLIAYSFFVEESVIVIPPAVTKFSVFEITGFAVTETLKMFITNKKKIKSIIKAHYLVLFKTLMSSLSSLKLKLIDDSNNILISNDLSNFVFFQK